MEGQSCAAATGPCSWPTASSAPAPEGTSCGPEGSSDGSSSTGDNMPTPNGQPQLPQSSSQNPQLQHSIGHHGHHHQRHLLSHHEGAKMRELDADILELGVTQPGTPLLTAALSPGSRGARSPSEGSAGMLQDTSHSFADRLPLLPETAAVTVVEADTVTGTASASASALDLPLSSLSAAFDSCLILEQQTVASSIENHNFEAAAVTPACTDTLGELPSPVKASYRRCLSGDDRQISTVGRSSSVTTLGLKTATARGYDYSADDDDKGMSTPTSAPTTATYPTTAASDASVPNIYKKDGSTNSAANGSSDVTGSTAATSTGAVSVDRDATVDVSRAVVDARNASLKVPHHQDDDGLAPLLLSPTHLVTAKDCREHPAVVVHDASAEHLRRLHLRSKSIDRALNEAVQFAEAVGEAPPTNEDEVRVIIEADNSSDDDDSDVEMMDEEEIAAEIAEMEKNEDAVESSFRRGSSFREDRDAVKSPYAAKSKYQRDESVEFGSFSALNSSILNLSTHSEAGELPVAQYLSGTGSKLDLNHISASNQGQDEMAAINDKEESRQERRIYPRLPPLKQAPTSTSGCRSHHHMTLLNKKGLNGKEDDNSAHSSSLSEYKGIHSKYLEVTNRGMSRGNYAKLHRKAWLEVSDKYHRYGKNLRTYYKHWESLGHPTNMFFDWLDSKGEAAGQPLPNLPECSRTDLDSDTVLYITNPEVQERYRLSIVTDVVIDADGGGPESADDSDSSDRYSDISNGDAILVDADEEPVRTGHEGWIFVLRDHALYAGQKVTSVSGKSKQRFHHSSFFGGKAVAAAGIIITDQHGRLRRMYPHSGHYRPTEAHMQRMLYFLQQGGFDLTSFEVDTQQILHVSRTIRTAPKGGAAAADDNGQTGDQKENVADDNANGAPEAIATKKCKKVQSLHLKPALYVACFLAHKARMIGEGVFGQIHKIRTEGVACVSEALERVDEGGYWKKLSLSFVMGLRDD